MRIVETTGKLSIGVQIITGLADALVLLLPRTRKVVLFKQLLLIELLVQIVEFFYYLWMIRNFKKKDNITIFRYLDWMVTTPFMLFTLMAYLGGDTSKGVKEFFNENKEIVYQVVVLNFTMLLLGFYGERGLLPVKTSVYLGFIPFIVMFYLIYKNFIENKALDKLRTNIFWYFVVVWGMYGIAALQPYEKKNAMYNILDLFAKNFFGIFLVYIILTGKT